MSNEPTTVLVDPFNPAWKLCVCYDWADEAPDDPPGVPRTHNRTIHGFLTEHNVLKSRPFNLLLTADNAPTP